MRGNVSTAEQSSIGRSPIIGETASPPKPRRKLNRPRCNARAGRHRSSDIAYVGFDNERTGVLGYVSGKKLPLGLCPSFRTLQSFIDSHGLFSPASTISHWSEQAFNLARRQSYMASQPKPGARSPRLIRAWFLFRIRKWCWCGMPGRSESPFRGARCSAFHRSWIHVIGLP